MLFRPHLLADGRPVPGKAPSCCTRAPGKRISAGTYRAGQACRIVVVRDHHGVLDQVFNRLVVQVPLPVAEQVFEMRFDDCPSLSYNVFHYRLFIIRHGLTLNNADRPFRAGPGTRPEPVTEKVAHQPCLPVNDLERTFRAIRYALSAPRALLLVYADNVSFHSRSPP